MNARPGRADLGRLEGGMRWMNVMLFVSLLLGLVLAILDPIWPKLDLHKQAFHFLYLGLVGQFVHNLLAAKSRQAHHRGAAIDPAR